MPYLLSVNDGINFNCELSRVNGSFKRSNILTSKDLKMLKFLANVFTPIQFLDVWMVLKPFIHLEMLALFVKLKARTLVYFILIPRDWLQVVHNYKLERKWHMSFTFCFKIKSENSEMEKWINRKDPKLRWDFYWQNNYELFSPKIWQFMGKVQGRKQLLEKKGKMNLA